MVSIVTEVNRTRLKYHRHMIRNQMYTARVYSAKLDYIRHAIRQIQLLLRLLRSGAFEKAGIVLTGLVESIWFHPPIESAQASAELPGVTIKCIPSVTGDPGMTSTGIPSIGESAGSAT